MVNISDTKISEFVELASPEGADYVPIVDSSLVVSNPATANKRALVSNLNPVTISPTAPSSIFVGKLWLDTDDTLTPGTQGVTGVQGNTGIRGLTGTQGATGIQGTTGVTGDQGVTGPQGITGSQGITGIQGQTGIQGVTGSQGVQGVTGIVGSTGDQGATGITGTTGAQGITGSQGVQGITGVVGSTGIQGATGVVGTTGAIGTTGAQGIQGQTGVIGTTGVQGYTGLQGNTGIQGVTGLQGVTGTQGITGIQGITGLQGITGAIGATGAVPTVMAITDDTTTNATMYPVWVTTASGNQAAKVSSTKLVFNPSTGNFGIGTTGPGAKLEVNGGVYVDGSQSGYSGGELTLNGGAGTQNVISTLATGAPTMFFDHRGTSNTGTWQWRNGTGGGTAEMTLSAGGLLTTTGALTVSGTSNSSIAGNVGIGTTGPGYKLDIALSSTSTLGQNIKNDNSSGGVILRLDNDLGNPFDLVNYGSAIAGNTNVATIAKAGTSVLETQNTNGLLIDAYANAPIYFATNHTEKVRITTGGNVGIGTTGPTANLNVVSATNSNTFRVENTFGASYTENQIYVNNYRASNSAFNLLRMDVNNGATTQFTVRGDGQVYMSGNVGIGTTNPTNGVLEVTGQVYFSANCSALSFTDRTPFYEGDALAELKGIKGKNGKIDHNTLPHFARAKHTVPDSKGKPLVQEERDLGAMISILTVASQQLDARLSKLEGVK